MTTLGAGTAVTDKLQPSPWWLRPFQMFQTNLREIDADLDVEKVLDFIQQHGANTWLINAGGILAFYPSDLPFQTRNPYLSSRFSGDLLGDAVEAAHARGLRVMGRMDFSKVYPDIAHAHPEWCFVSPSGQRQVYEGLVSVCPSAPYYQERSFDILTEVMDRYAVDGFFFNWFGYNEYDYGRVYHGVCHCVSCAETFSLATGLDQLPSGPGSEGYDDWKIHAARTVDELTGRLRAHIAQHRPDAALILGKKSDIIFHESNNAVGRELWHHATAEAVSAAKSVRADVPVLVNAVAFVDMPYRMAAEEPHHFAHYFAQAIARGANPSTYIMGPPGAVNYDNLPAAGEITRFHARFSEVYDGLMPAARIGCVRPNRLSQSASDYEQSLAEFRGFYSALQESHIPFDVVPLESLADMAVRGMLGRYQVLVLPDVGSLDDASVAALDDYAEGGGGVVATGSSAVAGDRTQLTCLPSTTVRAVHQGFESNKSSYFNDDGVDLPVVGTRRELAWKPGAIGHMKLLPPAPFGPPEKAYGHVATDDPGYAGLSVGDGWGVQFAWTVGRSYRELGTTNLRRAMIASIVSRVGSLPVVSVQMPEQLEVIVASNADSLVVHVLNFSGARRKSFGPPVPVSGALLKFTSGNYGDAQALVADVACKVRLDGNDLLVELPTIHLFEVLVLSNGSGETNKDV